MLGAKNENADFLFKLFSSKEQDKITAGLIEHRQKQGVKYQFISPAPQLREVSLDEKFLQRAKDIVQAHLSDVGFGVERMASDIHLSRAQLFRKLKSITGLSPNEFINNARLQKAAELILSNADTLTQISYSVGFKEQSYFAKRFRKKFGVPPSVYAQNRAFIIKYLTN